MVMLAIVLGVVVLLVRARARRRRTLAGLTSVAPAFSVAPPTRYTNSMKDGRL